MEAKYKLVYTTPEKIASNQNLKDIMERLYRKGLIDRFVIDEVHCVSSWGGDFRADYLELKLLKKNFPKVPILGLTATASQEVKEDVSAKLGITSKVIYFQSSFNRPNLVYEVRHKHNISNLDRDIGLLIRNRFKDKTGIVYCTSRKDCEKLSETLKRNYNIRCDYYHAELT